MVDPGPGHPVECRAGGQGVGPHVPEEEPGPDLEVGELNLREDAVEAVTGGSPHAAHEGRLLPPLFPL